MAQTDPSFMGIDPSMLTRLMKSMTSGVSGAQSVAQSYLGQFSRLGLDTGAVHKLLADYAWASSQQPMLQRRYSLSSHLPSGDFVGGMTTIGAGALTYATTAAAKSAGTAQAKQLQAYLDARDWAGIQQVLSAMKANGNDADYLSALFTQLGPSGLWQLSLYAQGGGDQGNEQEVRQIVGSGLATASFEMNLTRAFLQGIEPPNPMFGYATEQLPGGWDTSALAPFLTEGAFSSQWLGVIAPAVLNQRGVEMGEQVPPGYDAIFQAIAGNPGFAAQFYAQNSGQLSQYMTDPLLQKYLASDVGFGKFLEAATIPPKGATNTKPFTDNAATFIRLFGDSGADTTSTVRLVMAQVTASYFPDLLATLVSPAPSATGPLGLQPGEWTAFVEDAMKDNAAATFLLLGYVDWKKSIAGAELSHWQSWSIGKLNKFFATNYQAANPSGGGTSTLKSDLLGLAVSAGAGLLTTAAFAFAPEVVGPLLLGEVATAGTEVAGVTVTAAAAEAEREAEVAAEATLAEADQGGTTEGKFNLKEQLTQAAQGIASGGAGDFLTALGEPLTANGSTEPLSAAALAAALTSDQTNYTYAVNNVWTAGYPDPANPDGPPLKFPVGDIELGQTFPGDPVPYEKKYGGFFMDSSGRIDSLATIEKDPAALAAYNAWLQDEAIQNAAWSHFLDTTSAQSDGG